MSIVSDQLKKLLMFFQNRLLGICPKYWEFFSNKKRRKMEMRNRQHKEDPEQETPLFLNMRKSGGLPSAEDLLASNPTPRSGYAMKKDNSMMSIVLPCIYSKWKRRYFILVGNFLFRYADEHGEVPKGVPIPLESIIIKKIEPATMELSTIRKTYCIQLSNSQECDEWIAAIKLRKIESIRENMGHASVDNVVTIANKAGTKLLNKKLDQENHKANDLLNPLAMATGKL